jgi:hypothetical protein
MFAAAPRMVGSAAVDDVVASNASKGTAYDGSGNIV